jgi:hypothetical protein
VPSRDHARQFEGAGYHQGYAYRNSVQSVKVPEISSDRGQPLHIVIHKFSLQNTLYCKLICMSSKNLGGKARLREICGRPRSLWFSIEPQYPKEAAKRRDNIKGK